MADKPNPNIIDESQFLRDLESGAILRLPTNFSSNKIWRMAGVRLIVAASVRFQILRFYKTRALNSIQGRPAITPAVPGKNSNPVLPPKDSRTGGAPQNSRNSPPF